MSEWKHYPKQLVMPYGVSSGIRAKRCHKCGKIVFTNDSDFTICEKCKEEIESQNSLRITYLIAFSSLLLLLQLF